MMDASTTGIGPVFWQMVWMHPIIRQLFNRNRMEFSWPSSGVMTVLTDGIAYCYCICNMGMFSEVINMCFVYDMDIKINLHIYSTDR